MSLSPDERARLTQELGGSVEWARIFDQSAESFGSIGAAGVVRSFAIESPELGRLVPVWVWRVARACRGLPRELMYHALSWCRVAESFDHGLVLQRASALLALLALSENQESSIEALIYAADIGSARRAEGSGGRRKNLGVMAQLWRAELREELGL